MTTDYEPTKIPVLTMQDHQKHADNHQRRHRETAIAHARNLEAIGQLFGRPLQHVLERSHEDSTEHASEAFWHGRKHLEAVDRARVNANEENKRLSDRLDARAVQIAALREQIFVLTAELTRRAHRSGKPVPEMVEIAQQVAQLETEEAPF